MYEMLKEFIKPELLVLIPALYLIGTALKNSEVNNKHIPWILGVISVIFSTIVVISLTNITNLTEVLMAIFSGFTQGVLCAGASVYVNQIVKQASK